MKQLKLDDIKTEQSELINIPTELLMEELRNRGIDVNLIEHHNKYKEIDGYDETLWVTHKQHREIHNQWRKEGRVIPDVISKKARARTLKDRKCRTRYNNTHRKHIHFYTTLLPNIRVDESIWYNIKTGNVSVYSGFYTENNNKLYYINEVRL